MNDWLIKCFIVCPRTHPVRCPPHDAHSGSGDDNKNWHLEIQDVCFFYLKATLITHKTRTVLNLVPYVFRLGILLYPPAMKSTKKKAIHFPYIGVHFVCSRKVKQLALRNCYSQSNPREKKSLAMISNLGGRI